MRWPLGGHMTTRLTRERQDSASAKTTNLSRKALELKKQHLSRAPAKGRWPVLFLSAPWSGFAGQCCVGALFCCAHRDPAQENQK
jgi:hypothetical protein